MELRRGGRREGGARGVELRWSDAVVERLAAEGTNAKTGARDLQRTIERRVVVPLARWLIAHPEARGVALTLAADADGRISLGPG